MLTALYYPHTVLRGGGPHNPHRDEGLLKTALLLWDRLEFIVPHEGFPIRNSYSSREFNQAIELIGSGIVPNKTQKQRAHKMVEELVTSPLPADFAWDERIPDDQRYEIYPGKFLWETLDALKQTNLAMPGGGGADEDWVMGRNVGLAIMSILAEACAGTQKRLVTDQSNSYRLLARSIAELHKVPDGHAATDSERLVTIAAKLVDPKQFTLEELIKLREREQKKPGDQLRKLRIKFMTHVDTFVKRIAECHGDTADIQEIERQYEEEMRGDLVELQDSLKRNRTDVLASKDFGVGTFATAGSAIMAAGYSIPAMSLVAATGTVGTLWASGRAYKAKRRDVLSKHAMSWLLTASQRGPVKLH